MFRAINKALCPEIDAHILKNVGLFNKDFARAAQVCHAANDTIEFIKNNQALVLASLKSMTREKRLITAMKSEAAATCMLTDFVNELGGFNGYALTMYYQTNSASEGSLKLISGKYFADLADAHPALKDYILYRHSNKLHPEAKDRLTKELNLVNSNMPRTPQS